MTRNARLSGFAAILAGVAVAGVALWTAWRGGSPEAALPVTPAAIRVECDATGAVRVFADDNPVAYPSAKAGDPLAAVRRHYARGRPRLLVRAPADMPLGDLKLAPDGLFRPSPEGEGPQELVLETLDAAGEVKGRAELTFPACSKGEGRPEELTLESQGGYRWLVVGAGRATPVGIQDLPGCVESCPGARLVVSVLLRREDRFADWVEVAPLLQNPRVCAAYWRVERDAGATSPAFRIALPAGLSPVASRRSRPVR